MTNNDEKMNLHGQLIYEKMNLHARLSLVQQKMPKIEETGKGYNYTYAELKVLLPIVNRTLHKNGLVFHSETHMNEFGCFSRCFLTCWSTGECISTDVPLFGYDGKDPNDKSKTTMMQKLGACITYSRRYGLFCLLGLESDMDTDGRFIDADMDNDGSFGDSQTSNSNKDTNKTSQRPVEISFNRSSLIKELVLLWPQVREKGLTSNQRTAEWVDKHIVDNFHKVNTDHIDTMLTWIQNGCPSSIVKKEAA